MFLCGAEKKILKGHRMYYWICRMENDADSESEVRWLAVVYNNGNY